MVALVCSGSLARHGEGRVLPALLLQGLLPEARGQIARAEYGQAGLTDLVQALPDLLDTVPVRETLEIDCSKV
jgi:hypothetical protein